MEIINKQDILNLILFYKLASQPSSSPNAAGLQTAPVLGGLPPAQSAASKGGTAELKKSLEAMDRFRAQFESWKMGAQPPQS